MDPVREFVLASNQLNRLFDEALGRDAGESPRAPWMPAVDLREEEARFVVDVELPGVKKDDVEIHVENNVLTVRGERRFESGVKKESYHRVERTYGRFSRSFTLPVRVKVDAIEATLEDGVLSLSVPKAEEAKPRKIAVH